MQAWAMQEELVRERIAGIKNQDLIIFAEHESVYTLGRRGNKRNILVEDSLLKELGIPVYEVNRGGDITYHGPGQLLVYFIFHLSLFNYDPHAMMRWVEGLVIRSLMDFRLEGYRIPGKTGVFCNGKKIASIGLGFRKWVSFHGLAFNIDPDMNFFSYIKPCGLDIEMTSLLQELGRKVDIGEIKNIIKNYINES
jgi:lipoyl(octanoyl) transferase